MGKALIKEWIRIGRFLGGSPDLVAPKSLNVERDCTRNIVSQVQL
jgi:hypothetical protein